MASEEESVTNTIVGKQEADGSTDHRPADHRVADDHPTDRPVAVGDAVRLIQVQPYLKSADPMPMLRPPDLVDPEEIGQVVEIRALGLVAVRFRRGTFLIDIHQLIPRDPGEGPDSHG